MVEYVGRENFAPSSAEEVGRGAPSAARRKRGLKIGVGVLALAAGLTAVTHAGMQYWSVGRFIESTDDAYVKSDYTIIATKVPGYIATVFVGDNQKVKAGTPLAQIDDRDYRTALDQARGTADAARAAVLTIDTQIALQQQTIAGARAQLDAAKAAEIFAIQQDDRADQLRRNGTGTVTRSDETHAARTEATAGVAHSTAALAESESKVRVLNAQRLEALAANERADAALAQAKLNLSYTLIVAPIDGTVGSRSLRQGQLVAAGTPLMAVVPLHAVYVTANYKETQLTDMHPGQPVEIHVDSFPQLKIHGHVDSVSPAAGLEFALLPPDNATGNFTKVVQRIPVRIAIDDTLPEGLLRAGMSVEPQVDTRPN